MCIRFQFIHEKENGSLVDVRIYSGNLKARELKYIIGHGTNKKNLYIYIEYEQISEDPIYSLYLLLLILYMQLRQLY